MWQMEDSASLGWFCLWSQKVRLYFWSLYMEVTGYKVKQTLMPLTFLLAETNRASLGYILQLHHPLPCQALDLIQLSRSTEDLWSVHLLGASISLTLLHSQWIILHKQKSFQWNTSWRFGMCVSRIPFVKKKQNGGTRLFSLKVP